MSKWETWVALLAVILASLAALAIRGRLVFAMGAIALILLVGLARIRSGLGARRRPSAADPGERAERIRQARDRRYGGRR